ncbi:hypothetical protein RCL1_002205 [Eukaryota sp. TZLM3-RCL]
MTTHDSLNNNHGSIIITEYTEIVYSTYDYDYDSEVSESSETSSMSSASSSSQSSSPSPLNLQLSSSSSPLSSSTSSSPCSPSSSSPLPDPSPISPTAISSCLSSSDYETSQGRRILYFPQRPIPNSFPKSFEDYDHVTSNVYLDVLSDHIQDSPECNCKPSSGCGEGCVNRLARTLCDIETCPCKRNCTNSFLNPPRGLRSSNYRKFQIIPTRNCGHGLITNYSIKKDEFIIEYVGEVISTGLAQSRLAKLVRKGSPLYFLSLTSVLIIDAKRRGNQSRFINHSCDPNCRVEIWYYKGIPRAAVFANRDIKYGEELTFNYHYSKSYNLDMQCFCGSSKCCGRLSDKSRDNSDFYLDLIVPPKKFVPKLVEQLQENQEIINYLKRRKLKLPFLKRNLTTGIDSFKLMQQNEVIKRLIELEKIASKNNQEKKL